MSCCSFAQRGCSNIAKTQETKNLERQIFGSTAKQGVFGCFEVTIGWSGEERVDYLTYDTKGIWRCYEIKVSASDFRSKAKNTFVGHYNYYVMTRELYEKVKGEIPSHIGVYVGGRSVKRAKKQELLVDEEVLKSSLIRSLYREAEKVFKSENPTILDSFRRRLSYEQKQKVRYQEQYEELHRKVSKKFGHRWYIEE